MPGSRKPPLFDRGRADAAPPQPDSLDFSIETTTMRLKSLKLRRTEAAERAFDTPQKSAPSPAPAPAAASGQPSGRVRHDERGMAVWDWAVATGEFATLSATNVMRKLDVGDLQIEETRRDLKTVKPQGLDPGGGGDPYNTRGAGQRVGEAARRQGVTGAPERPRSSPVLDQLTGKDKKK